MKPRGYAVIAAIAALVASAMTLLPWVSLDDRGLPMSWSGLGFYYGDDIGVVPSIQPLGWAVVFVAMEALVLVGFELFATGQIVAVRRWLYLALGGLSAAVAVVIAVAIAIPALLYGSALERLGDFAGAEGDAIVGGRDVLNMPTLVGVVLWLAISAVTAGLGWRAVVTSDDS